MIRRGSPLAGGISAAVVAVVVAACGGKVDGVYLDGPSSPSPPSTGKRPGSSGGIPMRPPPAPATAESIAAQIAATYCKTFSSCCVGAAQPPIDVSRCRELITAEAMAVLAKRSSPFDNATADVCVAAIGTRMAICGKEDVAWQIINGTPALFASSSIQDACEAVVGRTDGTKNMPCSTSFNCGKGETCAVDICASNPGKGGDCTNQPCLDSFECSGGTCVVTATHDVGDMCGSDSECLLGLVCAKGSCLPARQFPELSKRRSSPYRVGADTCKAFTYL